MKKTFTTLTAAALLLAAAGCSTGNGNSDASAPASSASPSASPAGPGASPTASPVALADGFPSSLIPVMDGADILSSTVDRNGGTLTAVLVESSDAPVADVFAFYDKTFTAQGFAAADADAGAPDSRDYVRTGDGDPETINITAITEDGGPVTVTVGATVLSETVK